VFVVSGEVNSTFRGEVQWAEERTAFTADGRALTFEQAGDPGGFPVLVHFGTPNSRHLYPPEVTDAASRGLRLIGYDRPGYGESTRQPGRVVADCAADVRAICAELGISRLAMWGGSGGGPHVLACAALLPDLVTAVAALASVAPYPADGLDWLAGLPDEDDMRLFQAAMDDNPVPAHALLEQIRAEALAAVPDPDASEVERYVSLVMRDGLAAGIGGLWDDYVAFVRPWGVELGEISVPVLLMHGREDTTVDISHSEWLAPRIPGAETRFLDGEGHLSLLHRMPEVHAWLQEQSRRGA
jgi:pimeloyl-ACP methyl ester carboxylesterase